MHQLCYDGRWVTTNFRDPELLSELAPEHLQLLCKRLGGTVPLKDKPRFRLAWVQSRYQLTGGKNVTILDSNSNISFIYSGNVFLPRYQVPKQAHGWLVLEMFNTKEELIAKGYGKPEIEWDGATAIYCNEPAWEKGCYEAVMNGPMLPFIFPPDVPEEIIAWAFGAIRERMNMKPEDIIRAMKNRDKQEAEKQKQEIIYELSQKRRVNLGDPMISLANIDLGDQKEI